MAYAAYSEGLELGGTAPATAANAGAINNPKISRQYEVGLKREVSKRLSLAAAAFQIFRPYEFTDPNNVFVQRGAVTHSGLEFLAAGSPADRLRVIASATLINARQEGTGVEAFDGRAPVNIPWLRGQVTLDYASALFEGLGFNGSWSYVSEKYATPDNTLSVPAYHRFDLGVRYSQRAGPVRIVWRFRVENVIDTLYWKDVGEYFGDGYLHLGAPRIFKLSAQVEF